MSYVLINSWEKLQKKKKLFSAVRFGFKQL